MECPKYKKNNTWNIRLLVDDSFVPSSKQPSVIYCRLTDFKISLILGLFLSRNIMVFDFPHFVFFQVHYCWKHYWYNLWIHKPWAHPYITCDQIYVVQSPKRYQRGHSSLSNKVDCTKSQCVVITSQQTHTSRFYLHSILHYFFDWTPFLEARAEILKKISLVFWKIWKYQKDILKLTNL